MSISSYFFLAAVLQTTARLNYMEFCKLHLQSSFPNTTGCFIFHYFISLLFVFSCWEVVCVWGTWSALLLPVIVSMLALRSITHVRARQQICILVRWIGRRDSDAAGEIMVTDYNHSLQLCSRSLTAPVSPPEQNPNLVPRSGPQCRWRTVHTEVMSVGGAPSVCLHHFRSHLLPDRTDWNHTADLYTG